MQEPLDRSRFREAIRLCVDLFKHDSFRDLVKERIAPSDDILASDDARR